jgi:hypothetical protein
MKCRNLQTNRRWCIGIMAFTLATAGMLGCDGRSAAPTPAPTVSQTSDATTTAPSTFVPPSPLGETVELAGLRVRFVTQRDCSSPEPGVPGAGRRLVAAEFELTNASDAPRAINPFHFTLEDERRAKYVTSLVGCAPLLPARILAPKERARGFVPFEIPNATARVQLTLRSPESMPPGAVARFVADL